MAPSEEHQWYALWVSNVFAVFTLPFRCIHSVGVKPGVKPGQRQPLFRPEVDVHALGLILHQFHLGVVSVGFLRWFDERKGC